MVKKAITLFCLVSILALMSSPVQANPDKIKKQKDIPYTSSGKTDDKQRLDIYYPDGGEGHTVLFFIHGGGWKMGDRSKYTYLGKFFAGKGFVTVVISYRLSPKDQHPAHIRDVASAFAWTYKNVEKYGGNPDRIFVFGHSAGGHLSALLALDEQYLKAHSLSPNKIRGVIPIGGVFELAAPNKAGGKKFMEKLLEPAFGKDRTKWKDASPINLVKKDAPPFLILYGENERPLLTGQANRFYQALNNAGSYAEKKEIKGKNHMTEILNIGWGNDETSPLILEFIKKNL